MQSIVKIVAADAQGIINSHTWQATKAFCPKCGKNHANLWVLTSAPPAVLDNQELRFFLCVACNYTALGLNGFVPSWDVQRMAAQIIKEGFEEASV